MKKDSDDETEGSNTSIKSDPDTNTCQDRPLIASETVPVRSNRRHLVRSTPSTGLHLKHPLAKETPFEEDELTENGDEDSDEDQLNDLPFTENGEYLYPGERTGGRQDQTLARASLSQAAAQDRHEEFQGLLEESAALVDRMLGAPSSPVAPSPQLQQQQQQPSAFPNGSEIVSTYIPGASTSTDTVRRGGSVLGSLMRMEYQRQQAARTASTRQRPKPTKRRTQPKLKPKQQRDLTFEEDKIIKHKKDGTKSIYNMPQHSKSAEAIKRPKRPKMATSKSWLNESAEAIKRPIRPKMHTNPSWLSDMTKSTHLVPSLDKRKAQTNTPSRRSSRDSTMTSASQFEPISLEDRIRITFEIANILQKQTFLRKLVKCLMLYGCPAHRLEYIMREVSKTLNVQAEYVYLPNIMLMSFLDPDMHTTETHFVRQIQSFNMHKLGEIYRLEKLVSHGEVTVDEALEFIDKVTSERDFYPFWLGPFTYALASFCGCVMFYGGTWREAGLASALAVFFAIYEVFSGRLVNFQPIYEITCCIIIGFISRAVGQFDFCFTPVAFASFIVILPGYSMAISIVELVSRQLVCGVVRMVYAIIYSFLLGYGITMGSSIYATIDPSSMNQKGQCSRTEKASTCLTTVPEAFYFLTVPLFAVAYCVYLRARIPRWPVMITLAIIGFVVNWSLSCRATAPSQVLQVVPAFAIGLLGNLYTKFTQKMSFDAVLLSVFYLVPGSLGLKSALGFFGTTTGSEFSNQGGGFALSMIETSIGISIGLFVATLLVYPKGTAHTPLMNF